jgi:hypothetical protein
MSLSLHPRPSLRIVACEQLRLSGLLLRKGATLMLTVYLIMIAVMVRQVHRVTATDLLRGAAAPNFTFRPESSGIITLVAIMLPLLIWEGEDPTRRSYQWLMPLPQPIHTLIRVFAGWIWLMLATLIFLGGNFALVLITERMTGERQAYHPGFAAWEWIVPFSAATVTYLFTSAAAVGTRRPLVWVFGFAALYTLCITLLSRLGMPQASDALHALWAGSYGTRVAMAGMVSSQMGATTDQARDLTHWAGASALWGVCGAALLAVVSFRRRDAT